MKDCKCDNCSYCTGDFHSKRKWFHCNHPDYDYISNYFNEHKINKMVGFIGFGDNFADVPKNKTTPKWCPMNKYGGAI